MKIQTAMALKQILSDEEVMSYLASNILQTPPSNSNKERELMVEQDKAFITKVIEDMIVNFDVVVSDDMFFQKYEKTKVDMGLHKNKSIEPIGSGVGVSISRMSNPGDRDYSC